jgi:hypothetical protein
MAEDGNEDYSQLDDTELLQRFIIKKAKEHGVDPILATAVFKHESANFNPNVVSGKQKSSAGAIGVSQLMPGTAKQLGVDPNNPIENITGGIRYLKQQLDNNDTVENALRAYNAGPGAVQQSRKYKETNNYVSTISNDILKRFPEIGSIENLRQNAALNQTEDDQTPQQVSYKPSAQKKAIKPAQPSSRLGTPYLYKEINDFNTEHDAISQDFANAKTEEDRQIAEARLQSLRERALRLQKQAGDLVEIGNTGAGQWPYIKQRAGAKISQGPVLNQPDNFHGIPLDISPDGGAGRIRQEAQLTQGHPDAPLVRLLKNIGLVDSGRNTSNFGPSPIEQLAPGLYSKEAAGAEDAVRSLVTGGTLGIVDAGHVSNERLKLHTDEDVANRQAIRGGLKATAGVLSLLTPAGPLSIAGQGVEALAKLPAAERLLQTLSNLGRVGDAVGTGLKVGTTFGTVGAARELGERIPFTEALGGESTPGLGQEPIVDENGALTGYRPRTFLESAKHVGTQAAVGFGLGAGGKLLSDLGVSAAQRYQVVRKILTPEITQAIDNVAAGNAAKAEQITNQVLDEAVKAGATTVSDLKQFIIAGSAHALAGSASRKIAGEETSPMSLIQDFVFGGAGYRSGKTPLELRSGLRQANAERANFPDSTKPELMLPEDYMDVKGGTSDPASPAGQLELAIQNKYNELSTTSDRGKTLGEIEDLSTQHQQAIEAEHRVAIEQAIANNQPINARTAARYGIGIPEHYENAYGDAEYHPQIVGPKTSEPTVKTLGRSSQIPIDEGFLSGKIGTPPSPPSESISVEGIGNQLHRQRTVSQSDNAEIVKPRKTAEEILRESDRQMAESQKALEDSGTLVSNTPDLQSLVASVNPANKVEQKKVAEPESSESVRAIAREYAKQYGVDYGRTHGDYVTVDEDRAKKIADAYDAMEHNPNAPEVKKSYDALKQETKQQYDFLVSKGVKFEPYEGSGEPYKNSKEMREDVQKNNHLYFFLTNKAFGEGDQSADNPLLEDSGVKIGDHTLVYNDLFRAVHDYFGHAKEGYQFGARGEENAWKEHSRMYSDEALPALTAETRGQNSWVNYGGHLRNAEGNVIKKGEEGYIPPQNRPFAQQKAGLLPEEFNQRTAFDTNRMIDDVVNLHQENGGATFNPFKGDLADTKNYSVSIYPERTKILPGNPAKTDKGKFKKQLHSFVEANSDLLKDSKNSLGTWYDADSNQTYLDISVTLPHKNTAIALAKKHNQKAIFDLHHMSEITTGGTGEVHTKEKSANYEQKSSVNPSSIDNHIKQKYGTIRPQSAAGGHWLFADGSLTKNIALEHSQTAQEALKANGINVALDQARHKLGQKTGAVRVMIRKREVSVEIPNRITVEQLETIAKLRQEYKGGNFWYYIYDPKTRETINFGNDYSDFRREPIIQNTVEGIGHSVTELKSDREAAKEKFLKGSKVQQVVYHGTQAKDRTDEPLPFFNENYRDVGYHFGTVKQATDRIGHEALGFEDNSQIIPVHISLKNPLRLRDVGTWSNPHSVINELYEKGVISEEQTRQLYREVRGEDEAFLGVKLADREKATFEKIRTILRNKGYDGIEYINTYEDSNKGDFSYIVFSPNQIKSAIGNRGTFSPESGNIFEMKTKPGAEIENPFLFDLKPLEEKPSKQKVLDVVKKLTHKVHLEHGTIKVEVPRGSSYQARRDVIDAAVSRAVKLGLPQLKAQLAKPNDVNGITWYSTDIVIYKEIARQMFPTLEDKAHEDLLMILTAITSTGYKPYPNVKAAIRAYAAFVNTGTLPTRNPVNGRKWGRNSIGLGFELLNRLISEKGLKGAVDWLNTQHGQKELEVHKPTISGYAVKRGFGSMVFGAKIGSFAQNLQGVGHEITADMWWSRSWNQWMGNHDFDKLNEVQAPRSDLEREAMLESAEAMAKAIEDQTGQKLTIAEVQAVLWYYEKQVYEDEGIAGEQVSYAGTLRRIYNEQQQGQFHLTKQRKGSSRKVADGRKDANTRSDSARFGESKSSIQKRDAQRKLGRTEIERKRAKNLATQLGIDDEENLSNEDSRQIKFFKFGTELKTNSEKLTKVPDSREMVDKMNWTLKTGGSLKAPRIYVNDYALALINAANDFAAGRERPSSLPGGVAYPRSEARRLIEYLDDMLLTLKRKGKLDQEHLQKADGLVATVIRALRDAKHSGVGGIVFIRVNQTATFGGVRETLRHEIFHTDQFRYPSDEHIPLEDLYFSKHATENAKYYLDIAIKSLERMGYRAKHLSTELGAYLAGGPRNWDLLFSNDVLEDYGFWDTTWSPEQKYDAAMQLMELYTLETIDHYGVTAENLSQQWKFIDKTMRNIVLDKQEANARMEEARKSAQKEAKAELKRLQDEIKNNRRDTEQPKAASPSEDEGPRELRSFFSQNVPGSTTPVSQQNISQVSQTLTGPTERDSLLKTALTLRKAGLLTGTSTAFRNISSNTTSLLLEEIAKIPSSIFDVVVSQFTGMRTVTSPRVRDIIDSLDEVRRKGWSEFKEAMKGNNTDVDITGWENIFQGISQSRQAELSKIDAMKPNTGFELLDGYINAVFNFQSAQDRVFRLYAIRRSLLAQAEALAKTEVKQGLISKTDENDRRQEIVDGQNLSNELKAKMAMAAIEDAEFALFQNQNVVVKNLVERPAEKLEKYFDEKLQGSGYYIIRAPLEQIMPFRKTPANVIARTIAFTPAGFLKVAYKGAQLKSDRGKVAAIEDEISNIRVPASWPAKPTQGSMSQAVYDTELDNYKKLVKLSKDLADGMWDSKQSQKEFAEAFGRASVGSIFMLLGLLAAMTGFGVGFVSNRKRRALLEAANIPEGSLRVPGTNQWLKISDAQPFGTLFTIGASIWDQYQEEAKTTGERVTNVSKVASKIILDHPMISSMKETVEAIGDPGSTGAKAGRAGVSQLTSFIPAIVKTVTKSVDNTSRRGDTIGQEVEKNIPFLSKNVPARTDVFGRDVKTNRLASMLGLNVSKQDTSDVVKELLSHRVGIEPVSKKPDEKPSDTTTRNKTKGNVLYSTLSALIDNPQYKEMDKNTQTVSLKAMIREARKTKIESNNAPLLEADTLRVLHNTEVKTQQDKMLEAIKNREEFTRNPDEIKKEVKKLYADFEVKLAATATPKSMTNDVNINKRNFAARLEDGYFEKQTEKVLKFYGRKK